MVMIGYIPGAEAVEAVGKEIKSLKARAEEQGEQVLYLLDRESSSPALLWSSFFLSPPSASDSDV